MRSNNNDNISSPMLKKLLLHERKSPSNVTGHRLERVAPLFSASIARFFCGGSAMGFVPIVYTVCGVYSGVCGESAANGRPDMAPS